MTIDEINIGDVFIGTETVGKFKNEYSKAKVVVRDKTTNSVEVFIYAQSAEGINCYQWFRIEDFFKQFIVA